MKIYLIRHGMTEANVKSLYCGSSDVSLCEAGREELLGIRHEIGDVRFLTSGMKRANETLAILFGNVDYEVEPRFREVDFGVFEMFSFEQLKHREDFLAWFHADKEHNAPPGGESRGQMKARALQAFQEIREDTCIVTHGGVIAGIMEQMFPEERKTHKQWQPDNGHGYCITDQGYHAL